MNHLDTLRAIQDRTIHTSPMIPIDTDLSIEAGMDGNYGRMLQAARYLDRDAQPETSHSHTMINAATHYDRTIRELRSEVAALRALTDNAWAQYRAATLEDAIRHMDLIGKSLEGVPTWSDITDKLRAEDK